MPHAISRRRMPLSGQAFTKLLRFVETISQILPLVPGKSHTTVTIKYIVTDGEHRNPERIPGRWLRTVGFVRTYADGSHEPVSSWAFISLTKQEDGTWAVSDSDWHY